MNREKLLIVFAALFAIGFNYTEALARHVCQQNVKVPYIRKVNKTEQIPGGVTSVVEEEAYKFEIQSVCCPGYVGSPENCQRASTTSKDITSTSSVSPSTVNYVASDGDSESSKKLTETPSDNTETSEISVAAQGDNTNAVTDETTAFPNTTAQIETIATKEDWSSFAFWFFCIVVLVAFVAVLVKVLVHRNDRRAYVVNKKCTAFESNC
nr:uncharacterized protein LOC121502932 [Drosophila kikkawai]